MRPRLARVMTASVIEGRQKLIIRDRPGLAYWPKVGVTRAGCAHMRSRRRYPFVFAALVLRQVIPPDCQML